MIVVDCLVPSWWEVQVTVAAAFFVITAYYWFSISDAPPPPNVVNQQVGVDRLLFLFIYLFVE